MCIFSFKYENLCICIARKCVTKMCEYIIYNDMVAIYIHTGTYIYILLYIYIYILAERPLMQLCSHAAFHALALPSLRFTLRTHARTYELT